MHVKPLSNTRLDGSIIMGCTCKLFAIGAMCYGISALLAYAETRSEWASEYYEVEFLEGERDLCDHNRRARRVP